MTEDHDSMAHGRHPGEALLTWWDTGTAGGFAPEDFAEKSVLKDGLTEPFTPEKFLRRSRFSVDCHIAVRWGHLN